VSASFDADGVDGERPTPVARACRDLQGLVEELGLVSLTLTVVARDGVLAARVKQGPGVVRIEAQVPFGPGADTLGVAGGAPSVDGAIAAFRQQVGMLRGSMQKLEGL
jgi:hypothetical protein